LILAKSARAKETKMGGIGSGRRWRSEPTKIRVGQSLHVTPKHLGAKPSTGMAGIMRWAWPDGTSFSAAYLITGCDEALMVELLYRVPESRDMTMHVLLTASPTQFGGRRWWFRCPLFLRNRPCHRRVGKLYMPPGSPYFGCRKCLGLTYRSCQQAHQVERAFSRLGLSAEAARLWRRMHQHT
jgi:hypothetical protein